MQNLYSNVKFFEAKHSNTQQTVSPLFAPIFFILIW